jgi:hypothetical protein
MPRKATVDIASTAERLLKDNHRLRAAVSELIEVCESMVLVWKQGGFWYPEVTKRAEQAISRGTDSLAD